MSSGEFPLEIYHPTKAIGSGSFGSIVVVYDDEGEEYAMKLFDDDDSDDDANYGLSLGTLREISVLRLLREENSHPNVIAIHDVQTSFGDEDDEVLGVYAMAMPLYNQGSLNDTFSKITTKKQKVIIAFEILNAVAYLHENSFIHRDIKSDNILLRFNSSDEEDGDDLFHPVLIDFSLAKLVDVNNSAESGPTHTPSIGTPTYRAPEVVEEQPYGLPSDLWSVGVVLLELLQGKCIESLKDKGAMAYISQQLENLPQGQPFPSLIRGLLEPDPIKRWTARTAINCDLFSKFGLSEASNPKTFHRISLKSALPIEADENEDDYSFVGEEINNNQRRSGSGKKRTNSVLLKRSKFIRKVCNWMEWENPLTASAAMLYSSQMNEICGNIDDVNESNDLLDCLVLAHKFFERHLCGQESLDALYGKYGTGEFDAEEYGGNENSLFTMMDFCLYPR